MVRKSIAIITLTHNSVYMSSRSGAIAKSNRAKGNNETLFYKDAGIFVIPGSDGAYRNQFVIIITLRYMKGCGGGLKKSKFPHLLS